MSDVQKKLDELIARKNILISIIDNFHLEDIDKLVEEAGADSAIYEGIARYNRAQREKAINNFNNAQAKINQHVTLKNQQKINKSKNIVKESQRLEVLRQQKMKESRLMATKSRKLAAEGQKLGDTKRQMLYENQQLMKDSRKLNNQRVQLIRTITDDLVAANKSIFNYSANALWALINTIDNNIDSARLTLSESVTISKINELCNSREYQQEFIKTCLISGILPLNKHILNLSLLTVRSHCDWHYPGLQINPSSKEWIDCMVTSDPLYIIDQPDNNLTALLDNYPAEYIQRLRIYTVDDDYSILPQGQFGCITCCNFLNLYDLSNIEQFLDKFNKLLRPGGKLICNLHFLYNDVTAKLVDKKYFNYTINLIIEKIFNNMGYIIVSSNELSLEGNISMLITAQKLGTLTTSKAHQVLGSIIEK